MTSIFDGYPNPAVPGTVTPGTMPKRPTEYSFKRDWYLDQVYDPDIHQVSDVWTKYVVPYEGELVKDTANKLLYIVTKVDETTWKSTLTPFAFGEVTTDDTVPPLYPDHEYGMLMADYTLFIDYSSSPPVAKASSLAYESNPAYALLYYGGFDKENIISAVYANKDLIKNEIPVVTVMPPGFNVAQDIIKSADTFSVTLPKETLKNGERCYLVYYDASGRPLPKIYSLMVQQSAYLRDHKIGSRYVKSIELISPWFTNSATPKTLYIPVNVLLTSVVFLAQVNYNDGTSSLQTVNSFDGTSGFTLHGSDGFKPTTPNQKDSLVLTYKFQNGEQAEIADPGQPNHKSVGYDLIAVAVDGAYSPRLYTYPYWSGNSWKLKHFLGDLTRKFMLDVTSYVKLNRSSPAFAGSSYGVEQNLTFNLTLSDVSKSYNNWTFSQSMTITLYNEGTAALRKWDVISSKTIPAFQNLEILYIPQTDGTQKAKFNGPTTLAAFLELGYKAVDPPINLFREDKAITPTHMKLIRENGTSTTVPVGSYNNLGLNTFTLANAETFFIVWINRDAAGTELQLATSAAITRKVTAF